jgi:hypothetical protein
MIERIKVNLHSYSVGLKIKQTNIGHIIPTIYTHILGKGNRLKIFFLRFLKKNSQIKFKIQVHEILTSAGRGEVDSGSRT